MVDELPIDLLTHEFNSRVFLMFLRRQDERHREINISTRDRQLPSKYCSFNNARGFTRMNDYLSCIPSHIISEDGIRITNDLSKQLFDEDLSIVRRHWQRSKITLSNKIEQLQTDLSSHANISLKKAMPKCQAALFKWIAKNRLR
jgi:hypothetical protein